MTLEKRTFGTLDDGREVTEYLLGKQGGPRLRLLDLGAAVHGFRLRGDDPDSAVMVGFSTLDRQQESASAYFGAVVGRYANRIAHARFQLDGQTHQLTANEGSTALHGGVDGFSFRLWEVANEADDAITFRLVSPDGDQGFPGELTATATYRLLECGFRLELSAVTTAPTVCCLTSHAYLNLAGSGTAEEHLLSVDADQYVPIDVHSIPLGELADVADTPFDLRQPTRIAERVREEDEQIALAKGIDHSFQIRGTGMRRHARLECPANGRSLELFSDQPALQVYTGNFLDGSWIGSRGERLRQGDAIALEPHQHPDSPNRDWGSSPVLRPGETWSNTIEWRFG
ncbi:aldose epimerase family protein [Luteococcus sp. H138]|uniref:aldose epimerase family protein n=1 Tax=unclassified Luteococcus TaxID=2639923 RepID=UPI00313DE039